MLAAPLAALALAAALQLKGAVHAEHVEAELARVRIVERRCRFGVRKACVCVSRHSIPFL
jgi:hypothetical protein